MTFEKQKLKRDGGRELYQIEFRTDDHTEYEYEIDAVTGAVLAFDWNVKKDSTETTGGSAITEAKAKELALAQIPGASTGDIRKFKTDHDDGRLVYEGEIVYNGMEYEFEIDGYSGAFRSWEAEPADD